MSQRFQQASDRRFGQPFPERRRAPLNAVGEWVEALFNCLSSLGSLADSCHPLVWNKQAGEDYGEDGGGSNFVVVNDDEDSFYSKGISFSPRTLGWAGRLARVLRALSASGPSRSRLTEWLSDLPTNLT